MNDTNTPNDIEIPIEQEEQAQLLEMLFREKAVAKVNANLIVLPGIACPEDVGTEPHECQQCGNDIPAMRVKALMTQVMVAGKLVWKANPNALICVDCATANEKTGKQFNRVQTDDSAAF